MNRIGIDIGGTKVNIGLVNACGKILDQEVLPSLGAQQPAAFVDGIAQRVEKILKRNSIPIHEIEHIGVGIPGTADAVRGVVEFSNNLFGFEEVPLAELFQKRLGVEVSVVQDSWAAAYAEHRFGLEQRHKSLLCVTVGTGIGCGIILNGKVYAGPLHTAGELGHIPIVYNGRDCTCGKKGCLEQYCSGTAIWRQAMERFPGLLQNMEQKAESVFAIAEAGNCEALQLIDECMDKLAYGLAIMIDILSVDVIIISGGVCKQDKLYIAPLRDRMLAYGYPSWARQNNLTILKARLGSNSPMVGAAFLTADHMIS